MLKIYFAILLLKIKSFLVYNKTVNNKDRLIAKIDIKLNTTMKFV